MDRTIAASFLPHQDPEASLACWRDGLGFPVRDEVGDGGLRWITVGDAAEVVQEPTEQPYGVRDCAVRDPAGNLIRIQQPPLSRPAIAPEVKRLGLIRRKEVLRNG